MDFGKIEVLKEKLGDNEELAPVVSEIESHIKTLYENKENAVGEVKKFRGVKQSMAEILGLDKEIATDELLSNAKNIFSDYQNKIDSFQKNASSKEIENASVKEQLNSLTSKLSEITNQLNSEREANRLNLIKDKAREALSQLRINDKKSQDLVINANVNMLSEDTDFKAFAQSIANEYPSLTQSVHKPGTGSMPSTGNYNNSQSLNSIPVSDTKSRTKAIDARLREQGLIN